MDILNNVKISVKIIGGFVTIALIILILAVINYINSTSIGNNMSQIYDDGLVPTTHVYNAELAILSLR